MPLSIRHHRKVTPSQLESAAEAQRESAAEARREAVLKAAADHQADEYRAAVGRLLGEGSGQ